MKICNHIQIPDFEYNFFFNLLFVLIITFSCGIITFYYTNDIYLTLMCSGLSYTVFYLTVKIE